MKSKTKKILAGVGIGLTLAGSGMLMTGCTGGNVDQAKVDLLIEKFEKYMDTQNNINYDKLVEDINNYLDYEKNHIGYEEIKENMLRDFLNLIKVATTHNFTYRSGDRVTRVEYVSDTLTKVYHYLLDGENKVCEIYREITADNVITYVKDINLYSTVSFSDSKTEISMLTFDGSVDKALKVRNDNHNHEYVSWDDVYSSVSGNHIKGLDYYAYDILEELCSLYEELQEMPVEALQGLLLDLDLKSHLHVYRNCSVSYGHEEDENSQNIAYMEQVMEVGSYSYKNLVYRYSNYEGRPSDYDEESLYDEREIIFDEENKHTINFDTTGYQLVSDYYANL